MMYVDIKQTMWRRFYIDEEAPELKSLDVVTENKIMQHINDYCYDSEILYDTIEDMTADENYGEPTVELYDDDNNLLWNNVNGENKE